MRVIALESAPAQHFAAYAHFEEYAPSPQPAHPLRRIHSGQEGRQGASAENVQEIGGVVGIDWAQPPTLGDFQKLVRGDKEIPIWGLPDVITAMSSRPYKGGKHKVTQGESYIGLVRFNKEGPVIESIISFGNSDNPESDQIGRAHV